MFSVHSKPEELENATITGHVGLVFEVGQRNHVLFEEAPFSCQVDGRPTVAVKLRIPSR